MLFAASWIALRPLPGNRRQRYVKALGSMALGGGLTLALVSQGVLALDPWFEPRYMVPLGGMIFSNAMNTVSLAAERFEAETANQAPYELARRTALEAAFIPLVNSLFAVGLGRPTGHDDRPDPLRRVAADRGALPDHGDEHDVRLGGHCGGVLFGAGEARGVINRKRARWILEITCGPL